MRRKKMMKKTYLCGSIKKNAKLKIFKLFFVFVKKEAPCPAA